MHLTILIPHHHVQTMRIIHPVSVHRDGLKNTHILYHSVPIFKTPLSRSLLLLCGGLYITLIVHLSHHLVRRNYERRLYHCVCVTVPRGEQHAHTKDTLTSKTLRSLTYRSLNNARGSMGDRITRGRIQHNLPLCNRKRRSHQCLLLVSVRGIRQRSIVQNGTPIMRHTSTLIRHDISVQLCEVDEH